MRDLHVVAVSEDGRHLILGSGILDTGAEPAKATHRLPIDARLASALRGDLSKRPPPAAPRQGSATAGGSSGPPSVREIQARLRRGETVEQIAASAGLSVERIARFAGPVRSEQEKIIERARATPVTRSRRGQSSLPLGEVIELQFAQAASMRPESVRWTARREEAGTWIVKVTYVARGRSRSGSWRFDPKSGTLVAVDNVSAALGHSDSIEGTSAAIPASGVAPRGGKGTASRAASRAPKRPRRPPAAAAGARAAAGSGVAGTVPPPALRVVPALDAQGRPSAAPPAVAADAAPEPSPAPKRAGGTRGRASVPGWADVLLSTAPAPGRPTDEAAD